MNQTEFLVDFLRYYCANPAERRNLNPISHICRYKSQKATSEGCAIGRHLIGTPEQKEAWDACRMNTIRGIIQVLNGFTEDGEALSKDDGIGMVEDIRPEWMKEFPVEFMEEIQQLHDYDSRWSHNGLNEAGKLDVGMMVIKYGIPKEAVVEWVEDEFIPPFHK